MGEALAYDAENWSVPCTDNRDRRPLADLRLLAAFIRLFQTVVKRESLLNERPEHFVPIERVQLLHVFLTLLLLPRFDVVRWRGRNPCSPDKDCNP